MLRRLLSGFAIASLIICALVLVFWWRSFGHVDHLNLHRLTGRQTEFTSRSGVVMVTIVQNEAGMVSRRNDFYKYRQIASCCMIFPGLWLAVQIRSLLPRPGGLPRLR